MVEIKFHNTATRSKEVFTPIDPDNVRMYVCGPTVYDRAHLGNARPVVVFDVLYRLLREVYGPNHVTYVRNFTDVDDKIIERANRDGKEIDQITSETTQWYLDDMAALGALEPTAMPRATQHIDDMVTMIEGLIDSGHAYAAEGHVLFAVDSYDDYGKLSGRSVDDMIAGARVEVAPYKRNPMDFVLWKPARDGEPGWDSPWGRGRPGWHIECSAMSYGLLGESFDIHGGGNDLMFPHHENEIAQSKCAHAGAGFANVWLHNEMLQVEGKKMSKSLGNFFTVHDLLEQGVPGEVIRFVFLGTHYRKPMDWTEKKREEAEATLGKWHRMRGSNKPGAVPKAIVDAVANDLNTPEAISVLHKLANIGDIEGLLGGLDFLGLKTIDTEMLDLIREGEQERLSELEAKLTQLRIGAMNTKDYSQVDAMKSALIAAGVEVRMSKAGIELVPGAGFDRAKLEGL
ncbi:cysteinyl-tRNA synthetase [Maritimibacter alkaliphilus HTCC2654]|uniref:Cysteine--tRNA ligase n=1 Tax=Maritimibacter alkaliphilus HTCC2654 TaxID=314271 RepID=A3VJT9_9RHOB|nr:cysteine--tRNA ligase [Maritimibacter alkaliphilus]EAQ11445.1 cysteinyl-tRNA synthetase [Rhodobacterales bacterium HTCC2654] [Maritimibacter alkaliphilus HTCC2654]TYP83237.1 cysteinyl-tRNA synthetase [Maritimibacter alkaliphilus HTCC2654]